MYQEKERKNKKGITLIALIITIIVLLILAGVSISMVVGENGILNRATDASKKTQFASEKEAIEFIMSDIRTGLMIGEEIPKSKYLGKALSKQTLGNTTEWSVVTVDGKNYDNGWYLLEKDEEIYNYGKSKENWLINYNTGEIVELEEGKYSKVTAKDIENQVAKENLIFNLDSNLIDMAKNEDGEITKDSFENLLDENSELVNFNWDGATSGVTKISFIFDGVDDYIKVRYDDSLAYNSDGSPYNDEEGNQMTKKQIFEENGFTFEFYGKWNKGNSYFENNGEKTNDENPYDMHGLFCFRDINKSDLSSMGIRCYIMGLNKFYWSAGRGKFLSDNMESNENCQNIVYDINDLSFNSNDSIFIQLALDTSKIEKLDENEYYRANFYLNGNKIISGKYNKLQWNHFIENLLPNMDYFEVGRCQSVANYNWHYSKMETYAVRLYNKGLSEDELKESYQKSVAAHNKLIADSN